MKHNALVALAVALGIGLLVLAVRVLPVRDLLEAIRGLGLAGAAVFFAVFVILTLVPLPSTHLFVAAGLLYGTWWGALITTIGAVVVELLVMLLARTRLRTLIDKLSRRHANLAALDKAVSGASSFWVVWLLRLSPMVPFGLLNYAMAAVRISLPKRITANVLGMGPGNVGQAYAGSLLAGVEGLSNAGPHGVWRWVVLGIGLALTIAAALLTRSATRRVLDEYRATPQPTT